ncbi:Phosphoenolpyruvate/pyruvate domain-containing protein [Epithele typhae]|uniref:Phosphoenolpyruvate/pyruvate domain-containing protein n=1 Tax=Epithele typhae TaxID=378194 RepID=UPI002007BEE4|nr:Phosphoenolpyruvate/pyruvate domain-containing protein [Epithele typhae]KAH9919440.1 Phosphoenolpyruvate/pyruvate domain-containing protein [Epithele typhae]
MASKLAHPLLHALRAGGPAFGAWLTLPGALSARTAAAASPHLAWLVVDCEHGMTALHPGAGESIAAVAALGPRAPSTIVRIPATGACADGSAGWQIKYALDQGARGVLVPMVSTGAQAKSVVAAARFPPQGVRGFGSPFTQHAWGADVTPGEYLAHANDAVLVLVQIETRDGVANLDEILAVDGLDGVFIGPYDLSLALGLPPPSPDPHPEAETVIQTILAKAHAAGKKWSVPLRLSFRSLPRPNPVTNCRDLLHRGTQAAKRAKEGFDMVNVTSDSGAMSDGIAR